MTLNDLEQQIGVRFHDPNLLLQALTHRSFANENAADEIGDNERLEFLGDAILDFIVGEMLFHRFPEMPEGDLTRLRSALVRTEALAEVAAAMNLGDYLRMGKGEASSGGRRRMTNLCNSLEAFVGALYLDRGIDTVRDFILPRLEGRLAYVLEHNLHKDARSEVQEWCQAVIGITPKYQAVAAYGPDHEKEFMVEMFISNRVIARGVGHSKQAAAQAAARMAMKMLERGELTAESLARDIHPNNRHAVV